MHVHAKDLLFVATACELFFGGTWRHIRRISAIKANRGGLVLQLLQAIGTNQLALEGGYIAGITAENAGGVILF